MVMAKTKTSKIEKNIADTRGLALSNVFKVCGTDSVYAALKRLGISTEKTYTGGEEALQIRGNYNLHCNPKDVTLLKFIDGTYFSICKKETCSGKELLEYIEFALGGMLMSVQSLRQKSSNWFIYEALENVLYNSYDKGLITEYNIVRDIKDERLENMDSIGDNVARVARALVDNNLLIEEDYISYLQGRLKNKHKIDITFIAEDRNDLESAPHKVYRMHIDKYEYACIELPNKFIV